MRKLWGFFDDMHTAKTHLIKQNKCRIFHNAKAHEYSKVFINNRIYLKFQIRTCLPKWLIDIVMATTWE